MLSKQLITNKKISKAGIETRNRRKKMICKTYCIKIVKNKLSKSRRRELENLFVQANYIYNACVENVDNYNPKDNTILVKVGDKFEERSLTLSVQIRQAIRDRYINNVKALSGLEKRGKKVGKPKFKSYSNSIPLKQYGKTYKIKDDNIRIQNFGWFRVRGLEQVPKNCEYANANLVRKPSGYYVYITVYIPKEVEVKTGKNIGIDFGISNTITTSSGEFFNINIPETKGVALAYKRLSKAVPGSNNYTKRLNKAQRAYEKVANARKDKANKLVYYLVEENDIIVIQNDNFYSWYKVSYFKKTIRYSALTFVKMALRNSGKTIVIHRTFPSTKLCPQCNNLNPQTLKKRDYDCVYCGYHHDNRDVKAAIVLLNQALN